MMYCFVSCVVWDVEGLWLALEPHAKREERGRLNLHPSLQQIRWIKLKFEQRCTPADFKPFVWLKMWDQNRSLVCERGFPDSSTCKHLGERQFWTTPTVKKLTAMPLRGRERSSGEDQQYEVSQADSPSQSFFQPLRAGEGFLGWEHGLGRSVGIWEGWAGKELGAGTRPWALGRERRETPSHPVQPSPF